MSECIFKDCCFWQPNTEERECEGYDSDYCGVEMENDVCPDSQPCDGCRRQISYEDNYENDDGKIYCKKCAKKWGL